MYSKILVSVVISLFIVTPCFTQEKSKKELKEEAKIEKQKQIEAMINAKEFVFTARTAQPQGSRNVDLTTNTNFVKFHPDLIESSMPYFGEVHTSPGYGTDTGLKFQGKPEKFTVKKGKKNYEISVQVKGSGDFYTLSLTVGDEGSTTLIFVSNNRNTISYIGEISAPEKPVK